MALATSLGAKPVRKGYNVSGSSWDASHLSSFSRFEQATDLTSTHQTQQAPSPEHASRASPPSRRLTRSEYYVTSSSAMSASRTSRSGGSSHRSSRSGRSARAVQSSVQQLIDSLSTHRVNTLTELCRIERVAATCENEEDAVAFQGPMTAAWDYYVNSNQFLTELRGLTRSYPFCGDIIYDAHVRVRNDPNSNKSWNLAWLCLSKIQEDDLISGYAALEAAKPEMWGGREPSTEEAEQLAACFDYEWTKAVDTMLRHWPVPPTWY